LQTSPGTRHQTEPDLTVRLCGIELANPTVLASGVLGLSRGLLMRVAEGGAGAATIKSVSLEPREGHKSPCIIAYEAGVLNAVGYHPRFCERRGQGRARVRGGGGKADAVRLCGP